MSDLSTILGLPYIAPSQAQKHVTHNEALRMLDALVHLSAISSDLTAPPAASEGDRYLVAAAATGAWSGRDGQIAVRDTGAWAFLAPRAGWRCWVEDQAALLVHDGAGWLPPGPGVLQDVALFGLGTSADAATPFAAKLNAALLTALAAAEGGSGDMVLRANRETSTGDLGLALQTGYVTRALIGQFGSDTLRLAVSPDGSAFHDGIEIDNATGIASQPNLPRFKATTNFDNYLAADSWEKIGINTAEYNDQAAFDATTSLFTAPVDGTYLFGATLIFKENASTACRMRARLILNGTAEIAGSFAENSGPHVSEATALTVQTLTGLASGDTVELQGYLRDADGYFLAGKTEFWGLKVG